ncbi:glycine cleavage system aminomethyltransferase GcvT [Marivirga sp.]|uniref:glycine cleavage system aminomethyltransferase GcvT n=1 Tax=Marivirga sp. TaxID=2018662 RepID=UPI002D7FF2BE|nr:glycine cleavage system aminomethyltransferase GcvT [Marivirga sp.]HET8860825.1 glycine cleavage system aminomethyltransferase GcvT [Marivirga sp.]
MELKKVAINHIHEQLGAKMVPFAGYNMPVSYSGLIEEHNTVRNAVGIFDVSHMGEFLISGSKALDLIQKVFSNDASTLVVGKAQYGYLPNDKGGIVDDLLVYKIGEEEYMLVVNASNIEKDWNWISKQNEEFGAVMKNISDDFSLFAVQGPKAEDTLQKLTTDMDLSAIKFYNFQVAPFADAKYVIMSNTGYTGAGGFEVYMHNKDAESIWHKIMDAGEEFGIKAIGLGARDTLRMEMGFCLYGNDIDDTTSPIEAKLGWVTKFTKDFINSENLKKQKEEGVENKLVGFHMLDRGIPRKGYEILDIDGNTIGLVTSGTQSPTLGHGIGMGYVKTAFSKPETEIQIAVRKNKLKAVVKKIPLI